MNTEIKVYLVYLTILYIVFNWILIAFEYYFLGSILTILSLYFVSPMVVLNKPFEPSSIKLRILSAVVFTNLISSFLFVGTNINFTLFEIVFLIVLFCIGPISCLLLWLLKIKLKIFNKK